MPKPVSMFKTDDGTLFEKLADAIAHEQSAFLKSSLTPLFQRLVDAASAEGAVSADQMVAILSKDRELAAEFQKAFAKLQFTPTTPASRKRPSGGGSKKPTKEAPAAGAPPTPPAGTPPPAPAEVGVPPYVPPAGDPSEEHLAGIDSLGGTPIALPSDSEEAPPPPQPPQ